MDIYIVMFVLVILCSGFSSKTKVRLVKRSVNLFEPLWISFAIVAAFLGFRDSIGIDDQMHNEAFDQILAYGYPWRSVEFSYTLVCKLVQSINGNIQMVYMLYAVVSCLLMYYIVIKLVESRHRPIFIGIFLSFFLLTSLTLMRQFLAVTLLTVAYIKHKEGKKLQTILMLALAVFFHYSSILFILFWFLLPQVNKIKKDTKTIILMILFVFQYLPITSVIQSLVVNSSLDSIDYISYYLGSKSGYRLYATHLGIISIAYMIVFLVMQYKKSVRPIDIRDKKSDIAECDADMSSFAFLYFAVSMLFAPFGSLTRVAYSFSILACCYLCKYMDCFTTSSKIVLKFVSIVLFFGLFMYAVSTYSPDTSNINPIVPYRYNLQFFN